MLIKAFQANITNLILYIAIVLSAIGYCFISQVSIIAAILFLIYIFFSKDEQNIYLLYFLLPNVRLFSNIDLPQLVNVLYLLIGLKYALKKLKIQKKVFYCVYVCLSLCILDYVYSSINSENNMSIIVEIFSLTVNVFISLKLLSDEDIKINIEKCTNALVVGVLFSTAVVIIQEPLLLVKIVYSKRDLDRLCGLAVDPNFFSFYILICVALKCFLFYKLKKKIDILLVIVLSFIGIFGASKTYIILISLNLVYILTKVLKLKNIVMLFVFVISIYVFINNQRELMLGLFEKITHRFSESGYTGGMDSITSGRLSILQGYLTYIVQSPYSLIFGRGVAYKEYYSLHYEHIAYAHNSLVDMFLSFGLIGGFLFCFLYLSAFLKRYNLKRSFIYFLPVFNYVLLALVLSVFTSDMFWYLLVIVMLPLKKNNLLFMV